jgi:tRNA A-37 threonylcarbamoyl transferase component Bud32
MQIKAHSTPISSAEFDRLRKDARVLEMDLRGEKVLLTPDKHIIKLFYPRRRFTSATIYPYALRFWNNAQKLHKKGIATVRCEQLRYDKQNSRHVITYPLLAGQTLRDCLEKSPDNNDYLTKLSAFLAMLHEKGILFRSIHLGNILVLENGGFGLIDIADMSIQGRQLGLFKRARNFRHLLHDKVDRDSLERYGYKRFLEQYETDANISGFRCRLFRALVRYYAPAMTTYRA